MPANEQGWTSEWCGEGERGRVRAGGWTSEGCGEGERGRVRAGGWTSEGGEGALPKAINHHQHR